MYKKLICLLLAALFLLAAGCSTQAPEQPQQTELTEMQPSDTQSDIFSDEPAIAATWINAGQYGEGQEFVETMVLNEDGTVVIHMDYQGSNYETLTGTYTALQGVLTVTISADEPYQRIYQYALDANILTLYGNEKTVTYRRSD